MIDKVSKSSASGSILENKTLQSIEVDVLKLLGRYWPLITLCVVLSWAGTAAYYYLAPPVYESNAQVLLMPKDASLAAKGLDGKKDSNSTFSEDLLSTHMMLAQSPLIVRDALSKSNLTDLRSLEEAMYSDDRSTTDYVLRKLSVTRGGSGKAKNAQVLKLSFRHSNAEDAQAVVTAIVNEFQDFIKKEYADINQNAAELIAKAQDQLETELEKAEKEFREFRENAPLLWNGDQSTNIFRAEYEQIEAKLTDLRMEKSELETRSKMVENQLAAIDESGDGDLKRLALIDEKSAERIKIFLEIYGGKAETQIFQSQQPERLEAARSEYEGLLKLKARERSLITELGPAHPDVRIVREEIAAVESFLESKFGKLKVNTQEEMLNAKTLVNAYVALLKHDLSSLLAREKLLVEQSRRAELEAKTLVKYELQGEAMKLAVDRQKELYDATVDRLRDINLAKDFGGFVNELIAEPELGEEVWPKLSICGAVGTVIGLGLGCLLSLIMELRNRTLRSTEDVETVSGVPIISVIPTLTQHKSIRTKRAIAARGSTVAPIVYALHAPQSQEAEIFRGLRTSLFFRAGGIDARVIATTSPSAGDGKSTVLTNVAFSIAQAGKKVLVIDADMRRPTVAKVLGMKSALGLSELLSGKCSQIEATVVHPESTNLSIITSGSIPTNPSELLASEEFKHLILHAKESYDFVLVDCPPVLAVADPLVVSAVVDAVIVTIRVNPQSRSELRRTIEMLNEVNANVLGTVVNASVLESEAGSSGEYRLGYGYGSYGSKNMSYFQGVPAEGKKPRKPVAQK